MYKKRKIWLPVVIILILIFVIGIAASMPKSSEISGIEYFSMQGRYMDDLENFADQMDDVVSLYISGAIKEEDFLIHLQQLEEEEKIMKGLYDKEKKENPVKTGSHTYDTKAGCEAVEACFFAFESLVSEMEETSSEPEQIGYIYLSYHQEFADHLADYIVSLENVGLEDKTNE